MFLDLHCDTMLKIQNRFEDYRFSLKEADAQGGGLQIFACWLDVAEEEHPFHKAVAIIENFKRAVAQDSRIVLVRRYSEIPPVLSLGKTAALLSIEDCGILEGSLEHLHTLYQMGVRCCTLTWNFENEAASGCLASGGLKPFGKRLLREMERLSMVIDVSHLNRQGFFEVLSRVHTPVVASHSCCRALCPHPRNLDRRQCRLLFQTGGGIGVNFYPLFLTGTRLASVHDIVRHIEKFLDYSGGGGVGFGSDCDGTKFMPHGFQSTRDYTRLETLLSARFGKPAAQKVAYGNLLEVLARAL